MHKTGSFFLSGEMENMPVMVKMDPAELNHFLEQYAAPHPPQHISLQNLDMVSISKGPPLLFIPMVLLPWET